VVIERALEAAERAITTEMPDPLGSLDEFPGGGDPAVRAGGQALLANGTRRSGDRALAEMCRLRTPHGIVISIATWRRSCTIVVMLEQR